MTEKTKAVYTPETTREVKDPGFVEIKPRASDGELFKNWNLVVQQYSNGDGLISVCMSPELARELRRVLNELEEL